MIRSLTLLALFVPAAQAQTTRPEKLREAVCVPRPPFNFRYDWQFNSGEKAPSVEALEARLKKDASNPETHLALGAAYPPDQKEKRADCFRGVVALLKARVAERDCGGWEKAMFGRALAELERIDEGTEWCRKGIEAGPRDFRCRREMAHVERARVYQILGKDGAFSADWKLGPAGVFASSKGIKREQAEEAKKHVDKAAEYLTQTRLLAPVDEETVLERLGMLMENRMLASTCDVALGKLDPRAAGQLMLHPLFIEEMVLLGKARKTDFSCFAMAINVQLMLFQMEGAGAALTKAQKDRLVEILDPVARLVESEDKATAWNAAMMVGVMLEQLVDKGSGEFFYRKAVKAAPERATGVETLACCLVTQGRAKEAIEVMEEMHKRAPSLRTDLMLAFLLFDQGRLERAEELVRDLTAKHGKEPECQLALAAFCLRRSADGKQLEQAREHLARAEKALPSDAAAPAPEEMGAEEQDAPAAPGKGRIEFNRRDPNYWRSQHRFLKAIYMGLTDQPLKAWVELRTLRTENPQDQHVEAALRAFE